MQSVSVRAGRVVDSTVNRQTRTDKQKPTAGEFAEVLSERMSSAHEVKLSAHAQKRLLERRLTFSDQHRARLSDAVERIQQQGADRSLVLMDDVALVVSARNRTVITALDSAGAKNNVFTNIDSAVIV